MTDATGTEEERMARRVATLLQKAEDFRRHGEDGSADAALELAETIMLKYSLDAAIVAARSTNASAPEEIKTLTVQFTGIYRVALSVQFDQLVRAFSTTVRSFITKTERTELLYLVGYDSDIRQLHTLITSLQLQAIAHLNNWWKTYELRDRLPGMAGYKTRRQFVSSFVRGATDRIELARKTALASSEPGTELVLRDRRHLVDEFVSAKWNLTTKRTRMDGGNADAAAAGRAAGRRANTGDTPVGNTRRQISS